MVLCRCGTLLPHRSLLLLPVAPHFARCGRGRGDRRCTSRCYCSWCRWCSCYYYYCYYCYYYHC